jgi:hypothetical protein
VTFLSAGRGTVQVSFGGENHESDAFATLEQIVLVVDEEGNETTVSSVFGFDPDPDFSVDRARDTIVNDGS